MPSIKIHGIVLQAVNYKDYNRILTVLTPDRGIISFQARGCRKTNSKTLCLSESFTYAEYILYEKNNRFTLTGGSVYEMFYNLRLDPYKLSCATYIIQLCKCVIQENESYSELFDLVINSLKLLCKDEITTPIRVLNYFIYNFLIFTGYKPRLQHCVYCGKKIKKEQLLVAFDLYEGGSCCEECGSTSKLTILKPVYEDFINLSNINTIDEYLNNSENENIQKLVFNTLNAYVEVQLQQCMRSAKMLP